MNHTYTLVGPHTVTLTAIKIGDPAQTSSAAITITVQPGTLHQVTIELSEPNLDGTVSNSSPPRPWTNSAIRYPA